MQSVMIILSVFTVMFVCAILAKSAQQRDERKRKSELLKQIVKHYDGLPEVDACDVFYVSIIKQIARLKNQNANYEHLRRDANLVLELRNTFIENEVLRQLDDVDSRIISIRNLPAEALGTQAGRQSTIFNPKGIPHDSTDSQLARS